MDSFLLSKSYEHFLKGGADPFQRAVDLGSQPLEHRGSRGHRERMARQGSGLVDRTERRDRLHHVPAASVHPYRHPASHDLAERHEVRREPEGFVNRSPT